MDDKTREIVVNAADTASALGRRARDTISEAAGVAAEKMTNSASVAGEALSTAATKASDVASKTAELSLVIAGKASKVALSGATLVGDLNGDGKLDAADLRIAREGTAKAVAVVGEEVAEIGKSVVRSDMLKQAAAGAALGAVIAMPIPIIGSAIGASIGAIVGMWRSVAKPEIVIQQATAEGSPPRDALAEIEKLHEMKQNGSITEEEFETRKKKLLR